MKTIFGLILFSLIITQSFAQQPDIVWNQHFGGTQTDVGNAIAGDKHGGFIVASVSNSINDDITCNSKGNNVTYLMKFDSSHNLSWTDCYEGVAYSINATSDGGYVFAGFSDTAIGEINCNHGAQDFWIVKIDQLGKAQWSKCYGGSSTDIAYSVIQTNDGKYIAAGTSNSDDDNVGYHYGNVFNDNIWVIELNSGGNLIWSKVIGDSTYGYDANSLMQGSDGNYVVAGSYQVDFNGTANALIIKLDTAGEVIKDYTFGGIQGGSIAYAIVESPDHNFVFAGTTNYNMGECKGNHGGYDFWLVKADTSGNFIWGNCYGGSNDDEAFALCNTLDHGFVLVGETASSDGQITNYHGDNDYWVLKTDSAGLISWELDLGGSLGDFAEGVIQRNDRDYVITGYSYSRDGNFDTNYSIYDDIWVTELNDNTGVDHLPINSDINVYPNPVSNELIISSKQVLFTKIQIENVLGQTLINKIFSNRLQKQTIDVSSLPSGIYFYRVMNDNSQIISGEFIKNE